MEIKGTVERVTFYNEENNNTIAKLKVSGRHDLVTAVIR